MDQTAAPATAVSAPGSLVAPSSGTFTIVPRGPFDLRESAQLDYGQRLRPRWDGVMRMAFCLDGYQELVGVEVRQDAAGVHGVVRTAADRQVDLAAVRAQVARVLSLDHDADAYVAVGQRDPVVRRLLGAAPGLRPPLFYSPYEAAAWSVLSARRPAQQMDQVRTRLNEEHGERFDLAGESVAAFPTPERLLRVTAVSGLSADKVDRLHAVATAARRGRLDAARLARLPADSAMEDVQSLPGIGPFYAALIVVRAVGHTDVLPTDEPRLRALVGRLYGLPAAASAAELTEIAEAWRPFRTWVAVLVRAAGARLMTADE